MVNGSLTRSTVAGDEADRHGSDEASGPRPVVAARTSAGTASGMERLDVIQPARPKPAGGPGMPAATVRSLTASTFNVVYEDADEGWIYAHVPELPEVHTQGEDLDAARAMAMDALALVLEDRRARGEAAPQAARRRWKPSWPLSRTAR
jgi:predicted RNase H-like HicB family nuclease